MSLQSSLERLAAYRTNNTRESKETFEKGVALLKSRKFGDDKWSLFEQITLAAIDIGRLDVADECLRALGEKFPDSPRMDVLNGIRIEASQTLNVILAYYDEVMKASPSNGAAWKRRISVLRRAGLVEKAVDDLNEYLDTFYSDVEGWLELADIHSSCNQYTSALQALSHALLLTPQNPFTFLQFAETAYTAGDLPLALKMFLVVIDMNESEDEDTIPLGISVRAWWGTKLCTRQLVNSPNQVSESNTPVPKNIKLIDELATERVLTAYSGEQGIQARNLVSKWMSGR